MCGLTPHQLQSLIPGFSQLRLVDQPPRGMASSSPSLETGLYSYFLGMDPDGCPLLLLAPQLQAAALTPSPITLLPQVLRLGGMNSRSLLGRGVGTPVALQPLVWTVPSPYSLLAALLSPS